MTGAGRISARWQVSAADAAAVAIAYGLTVDTASLDPLGGAINGVARAHTDRGDVVIRGHRTATTPERLAGVHAIHRRLHACGIPVPELLQTTNGQSWTTLHDRLTEFAVYIPHGREADSSADGQAVMAMLGRVHAALRRFDGADLPAPLLSCFATPATALAMMARSEPAFHVHAGHPRYAAAADARREAEALYRRLLDVRPTYQAAVPRCLIHGDFVGANVLLDGDHRVVAVLDFDRLVVRERVYDVAYTLSYLIHRAGHVGTDGGMSDADLAYAASLLAAYNAHTHRPLTPDEYIALPYEMARSPLYPIAAADFATTGPLLDEAFVDTLIFAKHFPAARWLAQHASRVTQRLTTSLPT